MTTTTRTKATTATRTSKPTSRDKQAIAVSNWANGAKRATARIEHTARILAIAKRDGHAKNKQDAATLLSALKERGDALTSDPTDGKPVSKEQAKWAWSAALLMVKRDVVPRSFGSKVSQGESDCVAEVQAKYWDHVRANSARETAKRANAGKGAAGAADADPGQDKDDMGAYVAADSDSEGQSFAALLRQAQAIQAGLKGAQGRPEDRATLAATLAAMVDYLEDYAD